jgi:hypothetical protein
MALRSVVPRLPAIPVAWMFSCFVRVTPSNKRHRGSPNTDLMVTKEQKSEVGSVAMTERTP